VVGLDRPVLRLFFDWGRVLVFGFGFAFALGLVFGLVFGFRVAGRRFF
jgi:hypothetical protein